ncbi:hypothetical protein B0H14DRAFT_2622937 [Mycena olivaceomarginata]|nr:hypothetical protein B0H14DRAFT_2622937 [Mycena olivaceomarginata]
MRAQPAEAAKEFSESVIGEENIIPANFWSELDENSVRNLIYSVNQRVFFGCQARFFIQIRNGDSNDTGMKVDGYRILRLNSDQLYFTARSLTFAGRKSLAKRRAFQINLTSTISVSTAPRPRRPRHWLPTTLANLFGGKVLLPIGKPVHRAQVVSEEGLYMELLAAEYSAEEAHARVQGSGDDFEE